MIEKIVELIKIKIIFGLNHIFGLFRHENGSSNMYTMLLLLHIQLWFQTTWDIQVSSDDY